MKVVHSSSDTTLFLTACPHCDMPLHVRDYHGVGYWLDWLHDERPVSECPRCGGGLPELAWSYARREPTLAGIAEMDDLLAEQGEPPTCLEETERAGIDLGAAA